MKIIYTQLNIITFALCILSIPILSSENSWNLKPSTNNKNWFQNKIDAFAKQMITRHSYTHKSHEHIRDLGILHLLPTHISQAILAQQRDNMKKFLIKNEENALEDIRKYCGFSQEKWSKIMDQVKKEQEFNLSEMKKEQNFNTYHDPALPSCWNDALKSECKRHDINSNSLNFKFMTEKEKKISPEAIATTQGNLSSNGILWQNYNPGTIVLNNEIIKSIIKIDRPTKNIKALINHMACHEIMHAIKGDHQKDKLILIEYVTKKCLNDFSLSSLTNLSKEYSESGAHKYFLAACEKTADTLVACSNPEAAKNASLHIEFGGYIDNHNDILIINNNWETSQRIKNLQNTLQSIENKIKKALL